MAHLMSMLVNTGIVKEIEAQKVPDGVGVKGMYLSTWEGHADLQCSWVRESGMSKATKDWWRLESELRYPGYSDNDCPLYDDKQNSLVRKIFTIPASVAPLLPHA